MKASSVSPLERMVSPTSLKNSNNTLPSDPESSDSSGFLDSLKAAFSSDEAAKEDLKATDTADAEVDGDVDVTSMESSDEVTAEEKVLSSTGDDEATDAMLSGEEESSEKQGLGNQTQAEAHQSSFASDDEMSDTDASHHEAKSVTVAAAMSEGSELLDRLDEANQTLVTPKSIGDPASTVSVNSSGNPQESELQAALAATAHHSNDVDTSTIADSESDALMAVQADANILSENSVVSGEENSKIMSGVEQGVVAPSGQLQQDGDQQTIALQNGLQQSASPLGAAQHNQQNIHHQSIPWSSNVDSSTALGTSVAAEVGAGEEMILASGVVDEMVDGTLPSAAIQGGATPDHINQAVNPKHISEQQWVASQTQVPGGAAVLANSSAEVAANSANQQSMNSLSAQQAVPLSSVAAVASPVINSKEITANQMVNQKALQAAGLLGAAGGPNASGRTDKQQAEERLDQQIAGLTGLQGATQTQMKAESAQVQASSPLVLSKEMASEQLAERIQMMLAKNLKSVDIRLDPPELGRMQIRMTMNSDVATVQFTVANQQSRDIVEQSMPRLREMLAQQGVQLADTSVQQQSSGQQQGQMADGSSSQGGTATNSDSFDGDEMEGSINLDMNIAEKSDGISFYA